MRRVITPLIALVLAFLLWSPLSAPTTLAQAAAWQPNTAYAVNALVTYGGSTYKCLQAHTSLVGWEPPNVPALWQLQSSGPTATNTTVRPPTNTPNPSSIPPTKTSTPQPTSSGSCTAPAYNNSAIYTNGMQVSYNSHTWLAQWWTQGEVPSTGGSGVWKDLGLCGGVVPTNTPVNTATNMPRPGTATFTPTFIPSDGKLPRHVLTGYWQDFVNGARALRLRDVPTTYGLIAVAFADADPSKPGAVTFTIDSGLASALGGYTEANFISDVQALHSQGRKVIISVGGQNGIISVNDATSATNFANSIYSLMTRFGFDGVDIDLENGINPTYMTSALQQLSSKVGASLIITLAPQTIDMQSTSGGYFQLALNIKNILTIVNMQYYNSGSMLGCNGQVYSQGTVDFLTALACIQLQGGLRPDQVGLGLPASPSGAGGGYVSPTVVNNALDCLTRGTNCGSFHPSTTYPTLRGAMDWSINWDASNGYQFANTVTGHFGSLP